MRTLGLMALAAFIFALPAVAGAENDPRWNGKYDRLGKTLLVDPCTQCPRFAAPPPSNVEIGPGMEVSEHSVWRNRFRSIHSAPLWRARAFPGSAKRAHGFHGRRGHRGHGGRW